MHQIWNTSTRCNTEKLGIIGCNGDGTHEFPFENFPLSSLASKKKQIDPKLTSVIRKKKKHVRTALRISLYLLDPFEKLRLCQDDSFACLLQISFSSKKTDLRTSSPELQLLGSPQPFSSSALHTPGKFTKKNMHLSSFPIGTPKKVAIPKCTLQLLMFSFKGKVITLRETNIVTYPTLIYLPSQTSNPKALSKQDWKVVFHKTFQGVQSFDRVEPERGGTRMSSAAHFQRNVHQKRATFGKCVDSKTYGCGNVWQLYFV